MNSYRLEEPNTFHLKVKTPDESIKFDINSFIKSFIDDALLGRYCDKLVGILSYNNAQKIYTVTFNSKTTEKEMDEFLKTLKMYCKLSYHININFNYHLEIRWVSKTITLYPIPFDIMTSLIQQITKNWGKQEAFNFGRHKKYSFLRNPYLHLRFTDLQIDYNQRPSKLTTGVLPLFYWEKKI